MPRYIDAEIAIEKCNKLIDNADSCPNPYAIEGVRVVRNVILSECETGVLTADVAEVKHAYWVRYEQSYGLGYSIPGYKPTHYCSNCNGLGWEFYGTCPHCGAEMDGDKTVN